MDADALHRHGWEADDFADQPVGDEPSVLGEIFEPFKIGFNLLLGAQASRIRIETRIAGDLWAKRHRSLSPVHHNVKHFVFYTTADELSWQLTEHEKALIRLCRPTHSAGPLTLSEKKRSSPGLTRTAKSRKLVDRTRAPLPNSRHFSRTPDTMPPLGAHMSIAGGYHKAVRAASAAGCDCVQIFTKNNNQWRAKELTDKDCEAFRSALDELGITHPVAHNSYLINLGSPKDELWNKSIDAMVIELQRAEALGVPGVVAHPGSFTTSSEAEGLSRIAAGIDEIHRQTTGIGSRILLETTAGQGSNLGWRFEHLAEILSQAADPDRLGVCFDTCHVFAAGYAMETPEQYEETMQRLDRAVGCDRVAAFHLNDSLKPFGSRKDRHAPIGEGEMGLGPFRHLMNDPRFAETPMYLETPKGDYEGEDWDVINLRTLRGLAA